MAATARLGLLTIEGEVARGAASVVHAARSASGERLAVKVYDPEVRALHPGAMGFESAVHAGVVRWRSLLETGDLPRERLHRVTDLVQGVPGTLAELGSLRRAVVFWASLARVLGALHARGLAHGSVRPAHAAVLPGDRPLLLDPGVVPTPVGARRSPEAALYLAPEAVLDLLEERLPRATPRADVHGLAASLAAALGGSAPGAAALARRPSLEALLEAKRVARAPVVAAVTVPVRSVDARLLNEAIARALDPDPEARFPDGAAFARALEGAARAAGGSEAP